MQRDLAAERSYYHEPELGALLRPQVTCHGECSHAAPSIGALGLLSSPSLCLHSLFLCLVHVEAAAGSVALTNTALRHRRVGTCRVPWPQPRAGVGSGCLCHQVTGAQPGLCFLSIYQPDEHPQPLQGSCQGEGSRPWPTGVGLAHGRAPTAFRAAMTRGAEPSPVCQQRTVALCCWRGQDGS